MQLLIVSAPINGYERGDIIAVRPDGAPWGRRESIDQWVADGFNPADFETPEFTIVEVPGEPADLNLMEPELEDDGQGGTIEISRRGWRLDVDRLPAGLRRQIDSPGARVNMGRQRRDTIRRKQDGLPLPPRADSDNGETHRHDNTKLVRRPFNPLGAGSPASGGG